MQPQTSKIVTFFLIALIVLSAVYVYFSVRPTNDQVSQYQKPVISVPADILNKADANKLNQYDTNQPVPFTSDNTSRNNPFSTY